MKKITYKTKYQNVEVYDHSEYGKTLSIDQDIQTTLSDEFIYHEMMVHSAIDHVKNTKKVLIIGGGDGGCLREILKYKNIDEITLVDIDPEILTICSHHFSELNLGGEVFKDPRVSIHHEDGFHFIKNAQDFYDIIIIDSTCPDPNSHKLFSDDFYELAYRKLTNGGVLITQIGLSFIKSVYVENKIYKRYDDGHIFLIPVPSYNQGHIFIFIGFKGTASINYQHSSQIQTRYYNLSTYQSALRIPEWAKKFLKPC